MGDEGKRGVALVANYVQRWKMGCAHVGWSDVMSSAGRVEVGLGLSRRKHRQQQTEVSWWREFRPPTGG